MSDTTTSLPTDAQLFRSPVQSSETDERFTPYWVFEALGLTFDLDPASPVDGGDCVPADRKFTVLDDGLTQPWSGRVWLNPPFSNATPWADRFREHGNGVFLGPVANSRWFTDLAAEADALYLSRDFAFTHPTHAGRRSSMPLAFVAYGATCAAALGNLTHGGALVLPSTRYQPTEASDE